MSKSTAASAGSLTEPFRRVFGLARRFQATRPTLAALRISLLGGVAGQVTLAVTGVILARALGPQDRGHLAMLTLVWAAVGQFGAMGLPFALTYGVARVPGRAVETISQVRSAIGFRLLVTPLLAAALLAFLAAGRPTYVQVGAVVTIAVTAPGILQQCGLGVLQGLQKFKSYYVLGWGPNAVFAVAAGAMLLTGHAGFIQLTIAWAASMAIVVPLTVRKAWSEAERAHDSDAPNPPSAAWILRFGRRSMLGASSPIEQYRVDQAVVALFLDPVSLGLYVVAVAFTNLPRFVAQGIGVVANPRVASSETHDLARRRMWRFAWASIPIYLPIIAALWVVSPQLIDFFFGSQFADAAPVTRLLLVATALFSARRVLSDAARGAGYPLVGTVAELAALFASIPFFAIFVPGSGMRGVAYALIASSTVALAVLIGLLLRPRARRSIPDGWFRALSEDELATSGDAANWPEAR